MLRVATIRKFFLTAPTIGARMLSHPLERVRGDTHSVNQENYAMSKQLSIIEVVII